MNVLEILLCVIQKYHTSKVSFVWNWIPPLNMPVDTSRANLEFQPTRKPLLYLEIKHVVYFSFFTADFDFECTKLIASPGLNGKFLLANV